MYIPLRQSGVSDPDILYASYKLVYGQEILGSDLEKDQILCEFRKRRKLEIRYTCLFLFF